MVKKNNIQEQMEMISYLMSYDRAKILSEQSDFAMDRRIGIADKNAKALNMSATEYDDAMNDAIGADSFVELWDNWDHNISGYAELGLTIAGALLSATVVGAPLGVVLIGAGTAIGIADAVKYYEEGDPYMGTMMMALQVIPGGELVGVLKKAGINVKFGDDVVQWIGSKTPQALKDLLNKGKRSWDALTAMEKRALKALGDASPALVKTTASIAVKAFKAKLLGLSFERLFGTMIKLSKWTGKTVIKVAGVALTVDQLWTLGAAPKSWRMQMRDKASFAKIMDMAYAGTLDDALIDGLWAVWQKLWNSDGSENEQGRQEIKEEWANSIPDETLEDTETVKEMSDSITTGWATTINNLGSKWGTKVNVTTGNVVYPTTLNDLMSGQKLLQKGNKGILVKEIQKMLKELGYDLGDSGTNKDGVDGDYGDATRRAVYLFQIDNDLEDFDGIVGQDTSTKLKELYDAKKNEQQTQTTEE